MTFTSLLSTKAYRGNVLIYAACSASFFAWLTGSPFILHDMGYSPAAIGLSYVPQTIAFLVGGLWLSRGAAKMGRSADAALAAGTLRAERDRHWAVGFIPGAGLAEILIPFCVMAVANGAIYPIVVARRYVRSHRQQVVRPRFRIPCSWVCASWQAWWSLR